VVTTISITEVKVSSLKLQFTEKSPEDIQFNKLNICVSVEPKKLKNMIQEKTADNIKKKEVIICEYLSWVIFPKVEQYKKPNKGKKTIK
tara:strand:- start:938 stop:1204 length:267 start_codon:yes stop_codon:yes gene_type:complete